jgi:hypothetical protein
MNAIAIYKTKVAARNSVNCYLEKIGKVSPYATAMHSGGLNRVDVKTEIHYQPSDGVQNYHTNADFDSALSRAIRQNFRFLAEKAVALLDVDVQNAAKAASAELELLRSEFDVLNQVAANKDTREDAR